MILKTCLILGDSIAKGIAGIIKGCTVIAKVGMTSAWILAHTQHNPEIHYDKIIVSAGSNDLGNHYKHLSRNLNSIRSKNPDSKYIWIVPVNSVAAFDVHLVAESHGDKDISFIPGKDHVHPKSYKKLVDNIKKLWKYKNSNKPGV